MRVKKWCQLEFRVSQEADDPISQKLMFDQVSGFNVQFTPYLFFLNQAFVVSAANFGSPRLGHRFLAR